MTELSLSSVGSSLEEEEEEREREDIHLLFLPWALLPPNPLLPPSTPSERDHRVIPPKQHFLPHFSSQKEAAIFCNSVSTSDVVKGTILILRFLEELPLKEDF